MSKNKTLKLGDVLYIPQLEQLIEVLGAGENQGELLYWTDEYPEEVNTTKCRVMSSWIAFKHGIKLTNVRGEK